MMFLRLGSRARIVRSTMSRRTPQIRNQLRLFAVNPFDDSEENGKNKWVEHDEFMFTITTHSDPVCLCHATGPSCVELEVEMVSMGMRT